MIPDVPTDSMTAYTAPASFPEEVFTSRFVRLKVDEGLGHGAVKTLRPVELVVTFGVVDYVGIQRWVLLQINVCKAGSGCLLSRRCLIHRLLIYGSLIHRRRHGRRGYLRRECLDLPFGLALTDDAGYHSFLADFWVFCRFAMRIVMGFISIKLPPVNRMSASLLCIMLQGLSINGFQRPDVEDSKKVLKYDVISGIITCKLL